MQVGETIPVGLLLYCRYYRTCPADFPPPAL